MSEIEIKEISDAERNQVAELLAGSEPWIRLGTSLEQCNKVCHDREYILFTAKIKSDLCGAIILHRRGVAGSPYLKSIIVSEMYRRKGIGAALMNFAEEYFRIESKHMFLCVSSFNKHARIFYERLGYLQVGEFKDYIIDGESEILMYKRLR